MAKAVVDTKIQAAIDDVLAGLNVDFGAEEVSEVSLPWIQGSKNKPELDSEVHLCFPPSVLERLSDEAVEMLQTAEIKTNYSNVIGTALTPTNVRWIILAQPSKGFAQHKKEHHIAKIHPDMDFGGEYGWKTAVKLHLACLVGDEIMMNDDDEPQVWTLKLTSSQTAWVNKDKEFLSISDLNKRLKKQVGKKGWWTHLVSVDLGVWPTVYASKTDAKLNSVGLRFGFVGDGNPRVLSPANQAAIHELVQSEDFKALVADPFYVGDAVDTVSSYESDDDFVVPDVIAAATTLEDVSF